MPYLAELCGDRAALDRLAHAVLTAAGRDGYAELPRVRLEYNAALSRLPDPEAPISSVLLGMWLSRIGVERARTKQRGRKNLRLHAEEAARTISEFIPLRSAKWADVYGRLRRSGLVHNIPHAARLLGVSSKALETAKNAGRPIPNSWVATLCHLLRVSREWLLDVGGDATPPDDAAQIPDDFRATPHPVPDAPEPPSSSVPVRVVAAPLGLGDVLRVDGESVLHRVADAYGVMWDRAGQTTDDVLHDMRREIDDILTDGVTSDAAVRLLGAALAVAGGAPSHARL